MNVGGDGGPPRDGATAPPSPGSDRTSTIACWTIAAGLLALNIYRAASRSITHDEALGYQMFIEGSWRRPFAYAGAPNHVLFHALAKVTTAALGVSEFTLRLPTLAAAAVFYAAAIGLLMRIADRPALRVAGFAVLALNPYTLDFCSVARGYGLMLAFVFAALAVLPFASDGPLSARRTAAAGALLGLAIASVQIAVFVAAAMIVASFTADRRAGRSATALATALIMAVAAATTAAGLLVVQLMHARASDYYVGTASAWLALAGTVRAARTHGDPYISSAGALSRWDVAAAAAAAAIAAAIIGRAAWMCASRGPIGRGERGAVWFGTMLAAMAVAAWAVHSLTGLPYPQGRTALFWVPLWTVAGVASMASAAPRSLTRTLGWVVLVALLVNELARLPTTSYADWPYDAAGRQMVARLVADHGDSPRLVTIGGSWQFEPTLNFYRRTRALSWLKRVERRPPRPGNDYYMFTSQEAALVDTLGLDVLLVDGESGTVLAKAGRRGTPALAR